MSNLSTSIETVVKSFIRKAKEAGNREELGGGREKERKNRRQEGKK